MTKIYFLTNWGESSAEALKRYGKQTPGCSERWGNLIGTDNYDEADYYIILEGSKVDTPIDRSIYIKREPDFIDPVADLPYKHIIDFSITNGGVTYWLDKTYDELKSLPYPNKSRTISCIVSNKHHHRREYIQKLFEKRPDIDLYGRGHDKGYFGDRYKGELNYNGNCKFNGLIDYSYSIVMENSVQRNYWTEKLADAYLAWCMPLYWGCPNLNDFFPEKSYRVIDIDNPNPINEINSIISQPLSEKETSLINECRNLLLDEYNIWEVINKKIKAIEKNSTTEPNMKKIADNPSNNGRFNFLETGFHGDLYLLELVDTIMNKCNIFVETGTNVGSTLAYIANRFPNTTCFSCEPDKEAYSHAKANTAKFKNVNLYNEMSQNFIKQIFNSADTLNGETLFWLDAHDYGFQWPLLEEIKAITTNKENGYILIDDFLVPDHACFGYDEYDDQVCSFEYIKDALNKERKYNLYYPDYTDKTSMHHPLRGWALLEFWHNMELEFPESLHNRIKEIPLSI